MKRALPVYTIEGTDFVVDVANVQLYEKANPENKISLFDMEDTGDGYVLSYCNKTRNLPELSEDDDVKKVKIPELVQLDPVGMAEKYGISVNELEGKKDLDLMVDHEALRQRLAGVLPTIDIAGQAFYVDIRMDMLRPKDDFLSDGIVFSRIGDYFHYDDASYMIPYNCKTHEFDEPDYNNITSIPKDIILVSIPHESLLDPIGCNRKNGWHETTGLKEVNVKSHFDAKVIDWKETGIERTIQENIKKQGQQHKPDKDKHQAGKRQHRGPKL